MRKIKDCRCQAPTYIPEDRTIKSDFGRQIDLDLSSREKEFKNHMFPLNIVYDHIVCSNWQFDYQAYHEYNRETSERYAQFNKEILVTIQSYKIPIITLEKTTPKEAVCQVFENVNTGGVALTILGFGHIKGKSTLYHQKQ